MTVTAASRSDKQGARFVLRFPETLLVFGSEEIGE